MSIDHSEFRIVKLVDATTPLFDEGRPEESITFVYGKMETIDESIGGVSVACGDVNALGDPITFTATIRVDSPSSSDGTGGEYNFLLEVAGVTPDAPVHTDWFVL
jgi:hypothetical protein